METNGLPIQASERVHREASRTQYPIDWPALRYKGHAQLVLMFTVMYCVHRIASNLGQRERERERERKDTGKAISPDYIDRGCCKWFERHEFALGIPARRGWSALSSADQRTVYSTPFFCRPFEISRFRSVFFSRRGKTKFFLKLIKL